MYGGAGTGGFHPLGELALELEAFIHWASWRWNWKLSPIRHRIFLCFAVKACKH